MTEPKPATPRRRPAARTKAAVTPAQAAAPTAVEQATAPSMAPEETSPAAALELYFLRHADAGDPMEWPGDDSERPLSGKGRKQAKRLGVQLEALGFTPDALLTSPKLRALDTAKVFGRRVGAEPTVDQRLAAGFDPAALAELLGGLDSGATRVVLVGHDPDFSMLASWLVGSNLSLRKGALARVDLPDRALGPGLGALRWLLPPDAIPR